LDQSNGGKSLPAYRFGRATAHQGQARWAGPWLALEIRKKKNKKPAGEKEKGQQAKEKEERR
jgi:hypothetical protein